MIPKMSWLPYSLISIVFFTVMILLFNKILIRGISGPALMFFLSLFLMVFFLSHLIITKTTTSTVNNSVLFLILIAAFFSYVGNLFYTKAIVAAPNPGYPTAVIALQTVLVTVASFLLFKSEISFTKGMGIALAVVATVLLAL